MAIIRWQPWWTEPFADWDKLFEETLPTVKSFAPALDVYEKDSNIIVETPLAGVDPDDVKISIENDVLTVEGETKKKSEVDEKNYYRKEVRYGGFHRSVALPASVHGEKAKAEYEDGLLRVVVPKLAKAPSKAIKVQVKKKK